MSENIIMQSQKIRQEIYHLLCRLALLTDNLGLPDSSRKIISYADNVRSGSFKVLVMGDFSSGKTTLLNALLGEICLPVKLTPATAIITVICYGPEHKVTVTFHDHSPPEVFVGAELAKFQEKYCLRSENEMAGEISTEFTLVKEAILEYPLEILKNGVQFIDSPGLNESPLSTRITNEYLPYVDAVILTLRANQFFTMQEKQYVQEILAPLGRDKIFYVINMWDLIYQISENPEQATRDIWQRVRSELEPLLSYADQNLFARRVFPLSARNALLACLEEPPQLKQLEDSGLPDFVEGLETFLLEERTQALIDRSRQLVRGIVQEEVDTAFHNIALTNDLPASELTTRYQMVEKKLNELVTVQKTIAKNLSSITTQAQDEVLRSLWQFAEQMEEKLPKMIRDIKLDKISLWQILKKSRRLEIEEQFASALKNNLNQEISHFSRTTLAAILENHLRNIVVRLEKHASVYQNITKEAEVIFSGYALEAHIDRRKPSERWLAAGAACALPDSNHLLGSLVQDFPTFAKEITDGVIQTIVQSILAMLLVGGIFSFLGGIVIAAVALIFTLPSSLKNKSIEEMIKTRVTEEMKVKLRGKMTETIEQQEKEIKKQVKTVFQRLEKGITVSINEDIGNMKKGLSKILEMKDSNSFGAEKTRQWLQGISKEADAIMTAMDNIE